MSFNVGDRFGDYEVLSILGAGGMGQVYQVRNVISDRVEAAKVLLPDLEGNPELGERFLREIRLLAALDHPNIARLQTALRAGKQLLMIMEYVEGTTLEAMLHRGRVPLHEGINYIRQVLSALSYAHSKGIIHRDIKPANMMITPTGTVKLMDFGIAKAVADHGLTQTGNTVGSIYYMSPEQINGATELDQRCDIYSLGITMYEIVTGRRPFEGDSAYSLMAAHLKEAPLPPVELDPELPSALNEIILMAIAKDPAKRFQSADALLGALNSLEPVTTEASQPQPAVTATAPVTAATPTAAPTAAPAPAAPPAKPHSRRLVYIAAGSLATLAVLVLAAIQIPRWLGTRAMEEPGQAPTAVETPVSTQQVPGAALQQTPETPPQCSQGSKPPRVPVTAAKPAPSSTRTKPAPAPRVASSPSATPRNQAPAAAPAPAVAPRRSSPLAPARPAANVASRTVLPPRPPARDLAREKVLRDLHERMMLIAVRLSGVKQSITRLRQEQARMGLGLRSDITASSQRLEYYLDEAQSALKDANPTSAKKYLDLAERELGKLERFLGT